MSVEIIRWQIDPDDTDFLWAKIYTLNSSLEAVVYTIHPETSDIEAYVAANEASLETEILANGVVSDTLTALLREDDKQIRWFDGSGTEIAHVEVGLNEEMNIQADAKINIDTGDSIHIDGGNVVILNSHNLSTDGQLSGGTGQFAGGGILLQDDGSNIATVEAERVRTPLISDPFDDLVIDFNSVTLGDSLEVDGPLIIDPQTTSQNAINVNMPTNTTGDAFRAQYSGSNRIRMVAIETLSLLLFANADYGSGSTGCRLYLGRNTNGDGAAGHVNFWTRNGSARYVWVDASTDVRIHTAAPTTLASDTAGTVIGTQTSYAASKEIQDELPDLRESLQHIIDAARTGLRAFSYKNGNYNDEQFPCGVVTDYAPRYGMDRDEDHPQGKSLNVQTAIGDLMASVAVLAERIDALEARL